MKKKNHILHFNGRRLRTIGVSENFRFEIDAENDYEFMERLYENYEHIRPREFYIDGEKADYNQTANNYVTELSKRF